MKPIKEILNEPNSCGVWLLNPETNQVAVAYVEKTSEGNIIRLPFNMTYLDGILNLVDVEEDISNPEIMRMFTHYMVLPTAIKP